MGIVSLELFEHLVSDSWDFQEGIMTWEEVATELIDRFAECGIAVEGEARK